MALDTYTNLKAAIEAWSKRSDSKPQIDDFIDMAESEMYSNSTQPLRLRTMESRQTAAANTDSRFLQLPDLFLQMRRLKANLSGGDCDITYMAPEQMPLNGDSGIPRFFSVTTQIEFDRVPDSAYTIEMQLYKKLTPLSTSSETNAILTDHPTIYLYGALWALWQFFKEEQLSEFYYGKFINSIRGANKSDKRGRFGAAPKMRIEGATP